MWRAGDDEDHEGQQFLLLTSRNRIQTPNSVLDLRNFLPSSPPTNDKKRVSVAMRFQWAFLQLLHNAEFEELSARDLMLTSSLKTIIFLPCQYTLIGRKHLTFKDVLQTEEVHDWTKRLKLWLKELRLFQHSFQQEDMSSDDVLGVDELSDKELPIWFAAQRAVSCYEGLLSPIGPRERLLRRLFTWSGLISPTPEKTFEPDGDSNASEPYTSKIVHLPIFLSRISVSDIWRPATRKYCGNDIWKMLKTSTSILLSQSILQEPAFQELILLYTVVVDEKDTGQRVDVPSLQLKIYEQIPIPELPDIFPHKKLSFRIIDTWCSLYFMHLIVSASMVLVISFAKIIQSYEPCLFMFFKNLYSLIQQGDNSVCFIMQTVIIFCHRFFLRQFYAKNDGSKIFCLVYQLALLSYASLLSLVNFISQGVLFPTFITFYILCAFAIASKNEKQSLKFLILSLIKPTTLAKHYKLKKDLLILSGVSCLH
ncbi:hypothetical protein UlMin_026816 [Ulmus minor]